MRFFQKLVKSCWKRYYELKYGKAYFVHEYFGASFIINLKDVIGREIALRLFERDLLKNFTALCERVKPTLLLDIGANAGLYTCIVLRQGLAPKAIAFEPEPRNAAFLRANLLINKLTDRVEVHELAVSEKPGTLSFMDGPDANTGFARIVADDDPRKSRTVDVVTIDSMIAIRGETIAIKMDVENHEIEVLRGMKALLTGNKVVIQVEVNRTRKEVVELLRGWGYTLKGEFVSDVVLQNF